MPFTLAPVPEDYPFMNAEAIEATQPMLGPERPGRMARRGNHARRPGENNAHVAGENR